MPEPTLHPNLAKIAAAYDDIIERSSRRQITPSQARSLIAQLEARDDDGVRWSIDPDSGQWVRKTAFGDAEFDAAPPTSGYRTFDAHDLDPNSSAFNPADRLTFQAVSEAPPHPGSLLGATRRLEAEPAPTRSLTGLLRDRRALLVALVGVVVVAVAMWAARPDARQAPAPVTPTNVLAPVVPAPAAPAPEPAPAG